MAKQSDPLFSAQVRTGDRKAWKRVKKAMGSGIDSAAVDLGVSRRTMFYWLDKVDGLREFVEAGK